MATATHKILDEYLALEYPFNVIADPDGGWVIEYPDLPGCLSQADALDEIAPMAEAARRLDQNYIQGWAGNPPAVLPEEYSGKFNVRLPRSLHKRLVASAEHEGVSLNHYVATLLSTNDALRSLEGRLEQIEARLADRQAETAYEPAVVQRPA